MKAYSLKLLSPLYFRSRIDSGAAGSTVTNQWIGDIALLYAMNSALAIKQLKFGYTEHTSKYQEIRDFDTFTSVAMPSGPLSLTRVYDIATSFMSEGYPQADAMLKSGRAPFRNWMKRQGIQPGNEFTFVTFSKDGATPLPDRFTIRLGNSRETVAACSAIDSKEIRTIAINAYTLYLLFGVQKGNEIVSALKNIEPGMYIENSSYQYVLLKNLPIKFTSELLNPYN